MPQTVGSLLSRLGEFVGTRSPASTAINSAMLAGISFFYAFSLASFLKIIVYPLQDRVTYYSIFEAFVVNRYIDHVILGCATFVWLFFSIKGPKRMVSVVALIPVIYGAVLVDGIVLYAVALAALPTPLAILIYNTFARKKILNENSSKLTLTYLGLIGIALGIAGLALVLTGIFLPNDPVRDYTFEVFLIVSAITPVLMLMMISSVPIKIIIESGKKALKVAESQSLPSDKMGKRTKIILISLSMALSMVLAFIPHAPWINGDGQQVGVDTPYYVGWVNTLKSTSDWGEFLRQIFVVMNEGDRPLSLIFIYVVAIITNTDTFLVVEYLPVLLGPPLVLVVYFLTRELTSSDFASVTASFITAVSFHTLIGIYAGFYSNWFALIVGYVAFTVLLQHIKDPSNFKLAVFSALMLFLLFSHVYTWSIIAIAMGLFLVAMFKLRPDQRKSIMLLSLVVIATAVIDVSRIAMFGQAGGLERELRVAENQAGFDQFVSRWNNLQYGIHTFLGGLLSNFVILGLCLFWLFKSRAKDIASIFLLAYLSVGLLPLLFGDWVIQTRVLYNIPFQIPAAIAIAYLIRRPVGVPSAISAGIMLVWIALIAVSNFYLVLPEMR